MGGVSRDGSNRDTKKFLIWRPGEFVLTPKLYVQRMHTSTAWVSKRMHYRASENSTHFRMWMGPPNASGYPRASGTQCATVTDAVTSEGDRP